MTIEHKNKKKFTGKVVSTKMQNTITVLIADQKPDPRCGKIIKRTKKYLADTNSFEINEGDKVEIEECRPISKRKFFKVISIIKAEGAKQ